MHPRAAELIRLLGLVPHPEGGHYTEVFRAASRVQPLDGRSERPALTTIYFLLASGEVSRWHRVASDEAWHYYEGDALELYTADAELAEVVRFTLGRCAGDMRPVHVVEPRHWQAARSIGAYTLVGCSVGPGFDFADFEMLRDRPGSVETIKRRHPGLIDLV